MLHRYTPESAKAQKCTIVGTRFGFPKVDFSMPLGGNWWTVGEAISLLVSHNKTAAERRLV